MTTATKTECGVCGGGRLDDLARLDRDNPNVICFDCGGHFYKGRWWTKDEWFKYVNEVPEAGT